MQKLKKRADGRYCKTVTIDGKRKFIYGETLQEIEDKYLELKSKQKKGLVIEDDITLGQMAIEWYDTKIKDKKSQKTQEMYKSIINNHVIVFAGYKLKDIKPLMLEKYFNSLADKSKSLVHKVRITFNQIFKTAKANRLIEFNPIEGIVPIGQDDPKRLFLSDEEREIVLNALYGHRSYLWVFTLLNTGMREREALALTWNDFIEDSNIIVVNKALEFVRSQPVVKIPKTKAGIRDIPIPDELVDLLKHEKEKSNSIYIFHKKDGSQHSLTSSSNMWRKAKARLKKYIEDNNLDVNINLTYRLLRHTYATALFDAGIDIKSAQEILGHADFRVTMNIYTHIQKQRQQYNIIKIQNLYKDKNTKLAAQSS